MNSILKWVSLAASALALIMIFLGILAYLLGNILIFDVRYGTYLLFGHYVLITSILLVLLAILFKENKKD